MVQQVEGRVFVEEAGWSYWRFNFSEGYLDYLVCDAIENPNQEKRKGGMHLNSMSSWIRCNNGMWITSRQFKPDFYLNWTSLQEFTAYEVFIDGFKMEACAV